MALSTRARLAGIGGALAIGVLGAGGVAYATGGSGTDVSYVTTVDDQAPAPSTSDAEGTRKDCPEGAGGGAPAPTGGPSATGSSAEDA